MAETKEKVLEVNNLRVSFKTDHGIVKAVRGVSFDLYKGETLCIVGESGSGKSVSSKAIMGILANNSIVEDGKIMYEGENLLEISEEEYVNIRGHKIGMIFQDPLSSLNPIMRIGKQITEATLLNGNKLKQLFDKEIEREYITYRNLLTTRRVRINKINGQLTKDINEVKYGVLNSAKNDLNKLKDRHDGKVYRINDNYEVSLIDAKDLKREQIAAAKQAMRNELAEFDVPSEEQKAEARAAYDELVSKANASYEATAAKLLEEKNSKLEAENKSYAEACAPLKEKLSSKFNEAEKEANKVKIAELKAKAKEEIEAIKAEIDPKIPAAKEALKNSKVKAKVTVAEYKAKINADYNAKIQEAEQIKNNAFVKLNAKNLDPASSEYKENSKKINKEYKEAISNAKTSRIDSLKITRKEAKRRAIEIMKEVGIPYPEKRYRQYPFEFSGGMRQRIVIAIALTANPDVLICDEPTTALDVTIQAQILELINKLKRERNLSCIFITHDLGVVANMADRVAVMYAGKIVEYGLVNEIFYEPKHPYTWALLSSIPDLDSKEKLEAIPGTPPNLIYPPKGDAFADRSHYAMEIDYKAEPPYFKVSDTHYAATWLLAPNAPKVEMPKIVSERIRKSLAKGGKTNE